MAPLPRLRADKPLEAGQTTIFGTLNGGLSLQRPPAPPRPRRTPKWSGQADTVLRRRIVGGQNEKQVVQLFATVRLQQSKDTELGDLDAVNRVKDENKDYLLGRRYAYSREYKLAAINYFQTTWRKT
jgi:hypothetical protein